MTTTAGSQPTKIPTRVIFRGWVVKRRVCGKWKYIGNIGEPPFIYPTEWEAMDAGWGEGVAEKVNIVLAPTFGRKK